MYRLTRKEKNARHQIEGWLDREFDLEPGWVRENYMPGWDPRSFGEFNTPPQMAMEVANIVLAPSGAKILDPCAGIGSLLYPFMGGDYHLQGIELSREAHKVGKKLYPTLELYHADAFDRLDAIEGQFDYVIMNPPFGSPLGQNCAREVCESGAKLSQHTFLELAIRALKYKGKAVIIAPYNLLTRMPKKPLKWFENNMANLGGKPCLFGEFLLTKIKVAVFVVERISHPPTPDPVSLVEVSVKINCPQETFLQGEQLKLF